MFGRFMPRFLISALSQFRLVAFVTCGIFVGSRLNKSRKPGCSFSFSVGFLHVRISVSYLVIHQMVT